MPRCPTCNGTTLTGQPCRNGTCKFAPKCHHHTQVYVAPSPIHGQGLFAKTTIAQGVTIGDYRLGTRELTRAQFNAKYPSGRATHVWAPRDSGPYYDATNLQKSVVGAANTRRRANQTNARVNGNGKLITKGRISQGTEITWSYGRGFRI